MDYDPTQGLVMAIERIEQKLDKHDDKFDLIARTLQTLVKVDTETKENREAIRRAFEEIDIIKKVQNTSGCAAFKSFRSEHDNELKHNLAKIKSYEEFKEKFEKNLKDLELKPAKRWESVVTTSITVIVASIGGYIMAKIGVSK